MKDLFVYILTSERRTTLYIGVTNNLEGRLWQHQNGEGSKFAHHYNLTVLVYYETWPDPASAIARETQLKGWTRAKKDALISTLNPTWEDLAPSLFGKDSLVVRRGLPHSPIGVSQARLSTARSATLPPERSAQNDRGEGAQEGARERAKKARGEEKGAHE
ncbi:GIY-YIG nuclease family protein [Chthoniobacter flavus]|uniref:GIY-YIG nuclease family protein n=1 Tax=Chthoniobacter flavus TaxID=191863 RepID=UPI0007E8CECF|nr:GIY-YIG nuclease family protein [Chthoniobacter flavus]